MVFGAGVVIGAGLLLLKFLKSATSVRSKDEGNKPLLGLWVLWIVVAAVVVYVMFSVVYRAAHWTDGEALATVGLLMFGGALGGVVVAIWRQWRVRTRRWH